MDGLLTSAIASCGTITYAKLCCAQRLALQGPQVAIATSSDSVRVVTCHRRPVIYAEILPAVSEMTFNHHYLPRCCISLYIVQEYL